MVLREITIAAAICIVSLVEVGNSYRILGVFPAPSLSHQVVFRGLTLALNKKGHELVIVTPDPLNDSTLRNYTEIDIGSKIKIFDGVNLFEYRNKVNMFQFMRSLDCFHFMLNDILKHPQVRELYAPNSNEKFDLLLVETLYCPGVLPLAKRFDVPIIGVTSLGLFAHLQYAIGNPVVPSHPGNWDSNWKELHNPTFWKRLNNYLNVWSFIYWYRTTYVSRQLEIAKKYFGNDVPDLNEFEKNMSLVFVNQQSEISYNRPTTPNVIEIGGSHVSNKIAPLPKELQQFLDGATQGFVYVSFGSNIESSMLPRRTMNELIRAFSRLPYQVLWKFDDDELPNKPDNVRIMKWVPQQAVLGHRNLKVFVYQGGLQSTEEAVAHAVPLVGFPVFTDQDMQVNKMVSLGVAMKLEITSLDGNELFETITTVATDFSYKQRMLDLRSLIKDNAHDPLDNAVWWTEYVIRHRGAPHLRSSTIDVPWYSQQDMDILAFISVASALGLILSSVVSFRLIKFIYNILSNMITLETFCCLTHCPKNPTIHRSPLSSETIFLPCDHCAICARISKATLDCRCKPGLTTRRVYRVVCCKPGLRAAAIQTRNGGTEP